MKLLTVITVGILFAENCMGAGVTHYVATNGVNIFPYTNWADAANTITAAVAASAAGDTVLVSNGVYTTTPGSHIAISIGITVASVNGYAHTTVAGNQPPTVSNNVFLLDHPDIVVDGFTITNGYADRGGGIFLYRGTVRNCLVTGNTAAGGGNRCGGGIFMNNPGSTDYSLYRVIENCIIECNIALGVGGGAYGVQGAKVINCIIRNNTGIEGGAIKMSGQRWDLKNCLIYNNQQINSSCDGGGLSVASSVSNSTVVNCTIVSNYSARYAGGVFIAGHADTNLFVNCIIYSNACESGSSTNGDIYDNWYPTNNYPLFFYCCSTSNRTFQAGENNNITHEPIMRDWANQNYRLRMNSPCVNTGTNQDWMTNAVDLESNARILNNIVDMGAYETILWQGSIYHIGNQ